MAFLFGNFCVAVIYCLTYKISHMYLELILTLPPPSSCSQDCLGTQGEKLTFKILYFITNFYFSYILFPMTMEGNAFFQNFPSPLFKPVAVLAA